MYDKLTVGYPAQINDIINEWKYAPLTDSLGEIVGAIGVATEIKNRQKADAKLRSLFAAMNDFWLSIGRDDILELPRRKHKRINLPLNYWEGL